MTKVFCSVCGTETATPNCGCPGCGSSADYQAEDTSSDELVTTDGKSRRCNCGADSHPCAPHTPLFGEWEYCG